MNWRFLLSSLGVLCIGALLLAYRSYATDEPALARYAPPGAMLYLEAKDFSSLLAAWNDSRQKTAWLGSANYEMFSRSRLFLRLKEAGDQFAAAAGFPPDMHFAGQVAGSQSAVALYDIGKLQFLYITRLDPGKAEQTALYTSRSKFETRSAGGVTFYYRKDAGTGREAAFATSGSYLLLATREDLMAGALELVAGGKGASLESEAWWARPVAAAGAPGDLRVVLNLEKLVPSPYFRSYWIQKNVTEMKAYSAAVSDLQLSPHRYDEERVLLKKDESAAESPANAGAVSAAELARMVPADAGAYRIVAVPEAAATLALLEAQLLVPRLTLGNESQIAPQVQLTSGETGGGGDMETRIDQPPLAAGPQSAPSEALAALLAQNPVQASLHVQKTEPGMDGVFIRFHSAVVLAGNADWNEASVRAAIAEFVRPLLTTGALGAAWAEKGGYRELDGLWPLALSVRGKILILADQRRLIEEISANGESKTGAQPARFIAGWNHSRERARYLRLTRLLDGLAGSEEAGAPGFFSGNIASLSSVLAGFGSQKVVVRDAGGKILESVTYEWAD